MQKSARYAFILPDECLQHQTCSKCKKYLSCGPVKTYHFDDGAYEIRCGRCVKDDDGGVVSTINKLFENALFPCVNRLEGCNSVVGYKEMKAHEDNCKGTTIVCPICAAQDEYSLMALINHFKSKHFKNFLVKPLFNITQDATEHLLHYDITKNILVLITIEFTDKALNIKTLSSLKTGLRQKITIYNSSSQSDDSMEMYRSNFFNCIGIGDNYSEGVRIPMALIEQCTQLLCRMEFDLVGYKVQLIDRPELGTVSNKAFADKGVLVRLSCSGEEQRGELPENIPSVRCDEVFETFSQKYVLSDDHTEVTTVDSKECIPLICSTCQTFFVLADYYGSCRKCGVGSCRICPNHWCSISGQHVWNINSDAVSQYYSLNFYCKFKCGEYFRGKELVKHHDICELNKNKGLTSEEKMARYFGVMMDKSPKKLYQCNPILIFKHSLLKQGKMYVVRKDDISYIVDYTFENELFAFKVVHEYDNVEVFITYWEGDRSTCTTQGDRDIYKFAIPKETQWAFLAVNLKKKIDNAYLNKNKY